MKIPEFTIHLRDREKVRRSFRFIGALNWREKLGAWIAGWSITEAR